MTERINASPHEKKLLDILNKSHGDKAGVAHALKQELNQQSNLLDFEIHSNQRKAFRQGLDHILPEIPVTHKSSTAKKDKTIVTVYFPSAENKNSFCQRLLDILQQQTLTADLIKHPEKFRTNPPALLVQDQYSELLAQLNDQQMEPYTELLSDVDAENSYRHPVYIRTYQLQKTQESIYNVIRAIGTARRLSDNKNPKTALLSACDDLYAILSSDLEYYKKLAEKTPEFQGEHLAWLKKTVDALDKVRSHVDEALNANIPPRAHER